MKKFILFSLIILPTLLYSQGVIEVTFTNQSDFNAYNFQGSKSYIVKLYNDTNLPVSNQINSLQPLLAIDSVLSLYAEFTLLNSLDGLENIEGLGLFLEGNKLWDTLYIPDFIENLYGIRCERTFVEHIYGASHVKFLNGIELFDNDRLKTVDLNLSVLDSNSGFNGLSLIVQQNDSLKTFYWNNPHHMLNTLYFFENRQLKHIHIETVAEFVSGFSWEFGGFVFNPELDSISGFKGLKMSWIAQIRMNYLLDEVCVLQEPTQNAIDSLPIIENNFKIENNAVGLQSLNDLLTADCSWLPNGVQELESNTLSLYPNPAHNEVFVEQPQNQTTFQIYDMSGKIVATGFVESNGRVSLTGISGGMYILQVAEKRSKLVIQ